MAVELRPGEELVIRVQAAAEPVDDLIPIAADALAKLGLEYKPVLRLADDGVLKTVAIGRRRFTKRSYLVALVDALPVTKAAEPSALERDDLADAVRRRARRRVA